MFLHRSWLNIKISKNRHGFVDWKSTGDNDTNIFLLLENPCTFLLVKEKTWKHIFNTNNELLQNCTEKQIMPSKTTINWLFDDIWCYLFIACFDCKIGVFQQTVVRVYYILNFGLPILSLTACCHYSYSHFSLVGIGLFLGLLLLVILGFTWLTSVYFLVKLIWSWFYSVKLGWCLSF